MTLPVKIIAIASLGMTTFVETPGQPLWVKDTPSIASVGSLTITLNYGIDRIGTVYIIVYDFDNSSVLTSSMVRSIALSRPSGTIVETSVRPVRRGDAGKILQTLLNVNSPNQIHTIYLVAADGKGHLQSSPVRLTATTLPCPDANAGSGGDECDLNFLLNAIPTIGKGIWTKVTGPGNASYSPGASAPGATVTVTAYGTYIFRWTETSGSCKSSDDIEVNFYKPPAANAGTGGVECDLDFVLHAVPDIGTGRWTMTGGTGTATFSPDAGDPGATVTVSEYGTKVFTWTEVNGLCSNSSDITVNFNRQPIADAGTGGNNCGLETFLNATPSIGTGTWTRVSGPGNATFSPNANTPTPKVTVSVFGTYVFRWTEVNGSCKSSESISINFTGTSSANAGNGGDECDRNFQLNAVPGTGTGTWTKINGPGIATFSPNANRYNAIVTVSEFGAYDFAWTEVSFDCTSTDIIRVVFHSLPVVNAGVDAAVCRGNSINLVATGSGAFLWSPSNLLNNPAIPNPVATPVLTSVFTVTLTDQWGCKNTDQVTIDVRDKPVINAGPDQVLEYAFNTVLGASNLKINETGEWSVVSGSGEFDDEHDNNTRVTGLSPGSNLLKWTVTNGVCPVSSDTVSIRINDLFIPTMITPNQDGKNDIFFINGLENMGKTRLSVFNRWGALVYTDSNYLNNWDGKDFNGNLLPEDTYFYILKPEKDNPIKGYIVIRQ